MNYLDILVRASIDVIAATENIKLPNAGTQVRIPRASLSCSLSSTPRPWPEDTLFWTHVSHGTDTPFKEKVGHVLRWYPPQVVFQ